MKPFNLRSAIASTLTVVAGATSIYLATLPNPTQPQTDLGHTTNQIFLVGSQSLLKNRKE
ncbi:hypothetical protein [Phormidesmis priestleyi]|uniref:hypothetical protein n=1 Tax=Phormidesmis priestleyi TaxID=268141 RepID=UPI00083B79BA|nr:hypothetical protein [Phormidesmis priestleyi]